MNHNIPGGGIQPKTHKTDFTTPREDKNKRSLKVKMFEYEDVKSGKLDEFLADVDLLGQSPVMFRDNGVLVTYSDKVTQKAGLSKQDHVDLIKDEIARAEADLADSLLGLRETEIGFNRFKGRSGYKKVAEAYISQASRDYDEVQTKRATVIALKDLLFAIENDKIKFGRELVEESFDGEDLEPLNFEPKKVSEIQSGEGEDMGKAIESPTPVSVEEEDKDK